MAMSRIKIGLITIGQSPRADILTDWKFDREKIESFKPMDTLTPPGDSPIPSNIEFVHVGALDGIPPERMSEIQPSPGEGGFISRLKDGSWTLIDHEKLKPLMISCVEGLEKAGCRAILQLCTGSFSYLDTKALVIKPGSLCKSIIESTLGSEGRIGLFRPFPLREGQKKQDKPVRSPRWGDRETYSVNANPYEEPPEKIIPAVKEMKEQDVDIAYMGCLGYSYAHKRIAYEILQKPVILPRSVSARTLAELYGT